MDESKTVKSLRAVIGERLKSLREDRGERQETVADAVRFAGLEWTRSTVAAIEAGRREVALEELLLLSLAYRLPLSYFFEGDGRVELTPGATATRTVIRAKLTGDTQRWGPDDWDVPSDRAWPELLAILANYHRRYAWAWPDMPEGAEGMLAAAEAARVGEAEHTVAKRFGVAPVGVSMAAFGRWGRGFTAERDARVTQEAAPDASARSLQALRGHVSRGLIEELAPTLEQMAAMPYEEPPTAAELVEMTSTKKKGN
ncbi:MAG TPA: helix-turn-helix transcriptional regulator [Acidimicrobiales bacterium]|nr:helix-turn-helix transcriptional regulator [Acidimicrobiales bacterium]